MPTILGERDRVARLLGPGDINHLLTALQIFFRFMEIDAEVFDNSRLLAEGMTPPPRFTDYLRVCATQPPGRSVYEQMLDDFCPSEPVNSETLLNTSPVGKDEVSELPTGPNLESSSLAATGDLGR